MDDGGTDVRGEDRLIDWRLDELYERHARWAAQLAYLLTGDVDIAAELTQRSFVRVFGRFRDLREPFAFDAHLRRAVFSLARERDRREKGAPRVDGVDPVWRTLRSLPWSQRAVIVLRFGEDLSPEEAAQVLAVPRSRARSWEVAGMGALRVGAPAAVDAEGLVRRTLHHQLRDVRVAPHLGEATRARSRRRRNLSAGAIALASAIALFTLVVATQTLRGFSGGPRPTPVPTAVDDRDAWRGIFPQTTKRAAEREQRAADEGDAAAALQRDPDRVAADYAAEVLGWTTSVRELDSIVDPALRGPLVTSVFSCAPMAATTCEEQPLRVDLTLERPFVEAPRGIWVVTAASDPLPVEPLPPGVPPSFVAVRGTAVVRASTLTGHTLGTLARFPASADVQTIATDPRGNRVVVGLVAGDTSTIVIATSDGSAPPRVVVHGGFPALDPDGRRLAYVTSAPGPSRLVVRDLETGRERMWPAAPDRGEPLGRVAWLDERRLVVTLGSGSEPPTLRVVALDSTTSTVQEAPTPPPPPQTDAWWTPIGTWGPRPVLELTCCGPNPTSRSLVVADPDSWTVVGTAALDLPCCVPAVGDRPGPILMSGLAGTMFWIDAQGVRHGIGDGFAGPAAAWLEPTGTD